MILVHQWSSIPCSPGAPADWPAYLMMHMTTPSTRTSSVAWVLVTVNVGASEMEPGQLPINLMVKDMAALCGLYQMDWCCWVVVMIMTLVPPPSWLQLMERSDRCSPSSTIHGKYLHNNIIIINCPVCDDNNYRFACAIAEENYVTITGGRYSLDKVTRYRRDGQATTLALLQTGRRSHACGHYTDDNNEKVSNYFDIIYLPIMLQILLVTGGYGDNRLSSTEILTPDASRWTQAASLPRAVQGLR